MIAASSRANGEAATFRLWVFSDAHVATDKAVSDALRRGLASRDELAAARTRREEAS